MSQDAENPGNPGFFVGKQNENLRISTECVQLLRRILRRRYARCTRRDPDERHHSVAAAVHRQTSLNVSPATHSCIHSPPTCWPTATLFGPCRNCWAIADLLAHQTLEGEQVGGRVCVLHPSKNFLMKCSVAARPMRPQESVSGISFGQTAVQF